MFKKKPTIGRKRILKVCCSNIMIREIIDPVMAVASIVLTTNKPTELPELSSLVNQLKPAKIYLAKILSNATQETVLPDELSKITATIDTDDGYCKIGVNQTRNTLNPITIPFSLILKPAMDKDLYHGAMVRHKNLHPDMIRDILENL